MVELDNFTTSLLSFFSLTGLDDFLRGADASLQDIVWCGDAPGLNGVLPTLVTQLDLFCSLGSVPLLAMIGCYHSLGLLIG